MSCPIPTSDGQPCGRVTWQGDHCILHAPDENKPRAGFAAAVQAVADGTDASQRVPGDLTKIFWHDLSFEGISWNCAVDFTGGHFSGDCPFGQAVFHESAVFAKARIIGRIHGSPHFIKAVDFSSVDCDGFRLIDARFDGVSNFSSIHWTSDSWISRCTFSQLADFSKSSHGELYLSGCLFSAGVTFRDARCRLGLTDLGRVGGDIDLSGAHVFTTAFALRNFSGDLRCNRTEFDERVELIECDRVTADFSEARLHRGLLIARTSVALSFYRTASFYGSSWQRALLILAVMVFVILPSTFGATGLKPVTSAAAVEESISKCCPALPPIASNERAMRLLVRGLPFSQSFLRGVVHSVQVATFRDETVYEPLTVFGHTIEALGRALIATQVALLLLACRRRFSR